MNWLAIALVVLGLYLAFKVVGFLLRLLLWGVVLGGGYWLLAPYFGWPPLF
ncbi:DUF4175 domain-containing protein [Vulcaniibacterium gelatinicum]|uniref:DUF4175 domain-containing protein n=1 Tax=Vulcaniibacterium gelatinicum TaxID=2598725 RepID=UPI0011C84389|nr:DUF4175 domain-containing protein [Vulcaniibacterium gelatinicum]